MGTKPCLIPVIAAVGAGFLVACITTSSPVASLSIDFPSGEARLFIQRSGDTRIFYGELPQSRSVQPGTFDIDALFKQLQPKVHKVVPAEARPLGRPYGGVTFQFRDGRSMDYLIYDKQYAAELFKRACQNSEDRSVTSDEFLDRLCADLMSATPVR